MKTRPTALLTFLVVISLGLLASVATRNANAEGIGINFTGNSQFLLPTDQPGIAHQD